MDNINALKKQQSDIHPGFGSYLECMTRALFTGVAAFTLGNVCCCMWGTFLVEWPAGPCACTIITVQHMAG
ncbi:hypothetical protein Cfor_01683 [Coptotermes formosanus]|jgi:hypothetical protein|uniref:Uncharacterized protein n=1 Tax=Coptotermes formosanus TaxID=36987 RepID=A0A6L2Q794_COPFO|nr:hypothetical protein Cfor_01683 [Coptotermes formosanus]